MRFAILNTSHDRIFYVDAPTPRDAHKLFLATPKTLDHADFCNASLSEITIDSLTSYSPRFDSAFLDLTVFSNCRLERAMFRHASLVDTVFKGCSLYRARFEESDMRGVKFSGTELGSTVFIKCIFDESADYDDMVRRGCVFDRCTGLRIPPKEWELDGI
jgi:uncharacterized protein YjbI with pentapeptide repeats